MRTTLSILFLVFLLQGCSPKSDLLCTNKNGDQLTPLGCLVSRPWEFSVFSSAIYNVKTYYNDSLVSSKAAKYTELEKNMVFSLQKDNTLKYWMKSDYIQSPADTLSGGVMVKSDVPTDHTNLKNIYYGNWEANLADNTICIRFIDSKMFLKEMKGSFTNLGSTSMSYIETAVNDTTIGSRSVKLKRVLTKYLTH